MNGWVGAGGCEWVRMGASGCGLSGVIELVE